MTPGGSLQDGSWSPERPSCDTWDLQLPDPHSPGREFELTVDHAYAVKPPSDS